MNIIRRSATLAVVLAFVTTDTSHAACSDPMSQQEMNFCARKDYEAADKELNIAYKKAISGLEKNHENTLRKAQRAWIAFRDLACESYGQQAEGGSMQPMLINGCRARLTRERTKMLIEQGTVY